MLANLYYKGLSEHEKGLSDLNHSKMYREFITKESKLKLRCVISYLDKYVDINLLLR